VGASGAGTRAGRRLPSCPSGCARGCTLARKPLHLRAGLRASFDAPAAGDAAATEYVSDPGKPVPFRARPIHPTGYDNGLTWPLWLVDDQREASGRTDVVSFVSDVLTSPLKISGPPAPPTGGHSSRTCSRPRSRSAGRRS